LRKRSKGLLFGNQGHLAPPDHPPPVMTYSSYSFPADDDFEPNGSEWIPFDGDDDDDDTEDDVLDHPSLTVAERNPSLR